MATSRATAGRDHPPAVVEVGARLAADPPRLREWLGRQLRGVGGPDGVGLPSAYQDPASYLIDVFRAAPAATAEAVAAGALKLLDDESSGPMAFDLLRLLEALAVPAADRSAAVTRLDRLRTSAVRATGEDLYRQLLRAIATQVVGPTAQPELWESKLQADLTDPRYAAAAIGVISALSPLLAWRRLPDHVRSVGRKEGYVTVFFLADERGGDPAGWRGLSAITRSPGFAPVRPLLREALSSLGFDAVVRTGVADDPAPTRPPRTRVTRVEQPSYIATPATVVKDWYVIDATDLVVGRLAVLVADVLRGKHKPTYTYHCDVGDHVIVVNAEKVQFTGRKWKQKSYQNYSHYTGGQKITPAKEMLRRKPAEVLRRAVEGMIPTGPQANAQIRKLRIYAGPDHPHQAQQPKPLALRG